ncbi:MAG: DUF4164 family protein [Glycocaulis sp.]
MSETPPSESADTDPLVAAEARLLAAISGVERRMNALAGRIGEAEGDARAARHADEDRARLADQLDAARAREAELAEAAEEAGRALDEAMGELRAALTMAGGAG